MTEETVVFDLSDIAERAVKTGIEAGFVAVPVLLFVADGKNIAALALAFGIAAGSGAASVVLNAVQQFARSRSTKIQV